jgi:cell division septal protein FtsQ
MRQGLWDRRLGARGERKSPLTRFGIPTSTRIAPAPSQVEQPRGAEATGRRGPPAAALVLAASFAAGLGGGSSVAEAATRWLVGEAPRLEAIAVRGAGQMSSAEVAAATGVPRGVDLRGVDANEVAARLASHPWIASARAVELPAGRLLIDVVERQAVATLSAPGSRQFFAVDANGTPFAPAGGEATRALPRLVQSAPVAIGEPDPALAEAVDLAGRIKALGLPRPLEIGIAAPDDPTGFWLRLEDFAPRILLGRDDLDARLHALALVLEAGSPEAAQAAALDLRFADQVVLRGTPPGKEAVVATGPRKGAAASGPEASGGRVGSKPGGERP